MRVSNKREEDKKKRGDKMSATSADKMPDLSKFKAQEILNNMPTSKKVVVLGTFEGDSDKRSIVFLEKNAFTADDVWTENDMSNKLEERADGEYTDTGRNKKRKIFADSTQLEQVFINDIYGNFLCFPIPEHNSKFYFLDHCYFFSFSYFCVTIAFQFSSIPFSNRRIFTYNFFCFERMIDW